MEHAHVWGRRRGTYTRVEDEAWNMHTCGEEAWNINTYGGGMEHTHVWRMRHGINTCGGEGVEHKHVMDKVFNIAT